MSSTGRNNPCSCGSGKKYKKCCLRYEEDRTHLGKLRWRISQALIHYTLDQVLIGMRNYEDRSFKEEPFLHATVCGFALQFCHPGTTEETPPISSCSLKQILDAVGDYAYTDPIGFDKEEEEQLLGSDDAVVPLRLFAKQFEMNIESRQHFAEGLHLFSLIPEYLKKTASKKCVIDVRDAFIQEFTVTPEVFMKVCLIAWFTASDHVALEFQSVWDRVRIVEDVSEEACYKLLLDHLSADKSKFMRVAEKLSSNNPKTAMCGISPLYSYPFVRPWDDGSPEGFEERITSPIPNLIAYKASEGVYYQLLSKHGENFTKTFGHIFEEFVGRLLLSAFGPDRVIPESEITGRSKKPDFLVIEGDTALVIECKALRYRRDLLTDSTPESLANAMDKVGGGLVQIQEFLDDNRETLFRGRRFKQFIPVVVTYGKTHMMQAPALQVPREKMLEKKNVQLREWHLLNVHELELLEPHLKAGEELSQVIKHISKRTFSEVYQEVSARTGKAFADSFLYSFVDDMFKTRNAITNVCKETKGER